MLENAVLVVLLQPQTLVVLQCKTSNLFLVLIFFMRYEMIKGLVQEYKDYTTEDFEVWKFLYERQMPELQEVAAAEYLKGVKNIEFAANSVGGTNTWAKPAGVKSVHVVCVGGGGGGITSAGAQNIGSGYNFFFC